MINLLRKWLQKLKHKHQLPGEKNQKYPALESMQRPNPQAPNPQRTTQRSTEGKEDKLTYEGVFESVTDEYLQLLHRTNRLHPFCFMVNLEVQLHNEGVNRKKP